MAETYYARACGVQESYRGGLCTRDEAMRKLRVLEVLSFGAIAKKRSEKAKQKAAQEWRAVESVRERLNAKPWCHPCHGRGHSIQSGEPCAHCRGSGTRGGVTR